MSDNFSYDTYLSPFTTRYGSPEMRHIWSEENKRLLWRKVWIALAEAEYKAGLLSKKELYDLKKYQTTLNIPKAKATEKEIYHELMAEIKTYSEQATIGGGKLHLGATSADILDSTTILQIQASMQLIRHKVRMLLEEFAKKINLYENTVCMGYTHLQPAEPTTLGYRLAFYAQDLLYDAMLLNGGGNFLKTKGLKGAVGTSASYTQLLQSTNTNASLLEKDVLSALGLDAVTISGQTYPRKIDWIFITILSGIAQSLHKFCFDYRILQAAPYGEWMEKRDSKRVGSSAMPFKRNPDKAEKVCSLSRYVSSLVGVAWTNPAMSLLERTLDDSANQRIFLPEAFLAIDECLTTTMALLENLEINEAMIKKNVDTYGVFAATEPLLMTLVKKGANRQTMHEKIKILSMQAWEAVQKNEPNTLPQLLAKDTEIHQLIEEKELQQMMDPITHIGLARKQTKKFLKELNTFLCR